ncbi:unnamed protein product [Moneuplotes crassus]|uniref:Uncharacterized protein n=1 Tax=Euplotes crassus TaxID=5936 RepID=A0AAD2D091_EUPCR|nr:unnamed protein product [Moneuplotes crassus]
MVKLFQTWFLLALVISVATCKNGHLGYFTRLPDFRLSYFSTRYEIYLERILTVINSIKPVVAAFGDDIRSFPDTLRLFNLLLSAILAYYSCDTLGCITPEAVLMRFMKDFRNFSRIIVSELDYGFYSLLLSYAKKEFSIINKIIQNESFDTYQERSDCIRMRIGQYFMPTFIGNDTSDCSKFDEIIKSFSEQPVDLGESWHSLFIRLTILKALVGGNYICYTLALQEWRRYHTLRDISSSQNSNEQFKTPSPSLNQRYEEIFSEHDENKDCPHSSNENSSKYQRLLFGCSPVL